MPNRLLYAIENRVLHIKIIGKGTVCNYKSVKEQVLKILNSPCVDGVEFDVRDVCYMDSTFIGLLLGINKILKRSHKEGLVICNISKELLEIFKEVEVDQLFNLSSDNKKNNLTFKEITFLADEEPCAQEILEAHRHLQEISPKNRNKFSLLSRLLKHTSKGTKKKKNSKN